MIVFILMFSCIPKNGIYVLVKNRSHETIKNIQISTSDQKAAVNLKTLKASEDKKVMLDMSQIEESDGSYTIKFTRNNDITYTKSGGYYTNGVPLNHKIIFIIKKDTVLIESSIF